MSQPWASLVRKTDDHWYWRGTTDDKGYGRWWEGGRGGRPRQAHRVVYEAEVGPIPDGMTLDHLCRVRDCVNPAHLEPVTNLENVMRGESLPAQNARKDECDHGHPFTDENTYVHPTTGFRYCRKCRKERAQARRDRDAAFLAKRPDYEAAVDALSIIMAGLNGQVVVENASSVWWNATEAADAALARLRGKVPA